MSPAITQALKRLPAFEPPPDSWAKVQARLQASPSSHRIAAWQYIGLAAALLLIMAGVFRDGLFSPGAAPFRQPSIDDLVQRSQQLEAILEILPSRPAVERAGTSATIDELQSSIQLVDLRLTDLTKDPAHLQDQQRLWNTRVALLDSLVTVRYAEAASSGGFTAIDSGVT